MRELDIVEYKKVTFEVLKKIDKICRQHGINYFLFAGTLLGAVRHKGFIPWDDDIDICMLRADYDRLAHIIQEGKYGLNFIRIEEHPDTFFPYGKICDTNTVMVEKNFKTIKGYGAFVDVFPFDFLPNSGKKRLKINKKFFRRYQLLQHSARVSFEVSDSRMTNLKRRAAFIISRFFNAHKIAKKMNDDFKSLNEKPTDYVGLGWHKTAWLYDDYCEVSEVEFEGNCFFAPKNPDRVLKAHFGDYMKLPPEEKRVSNHQLKCYGLRNALLLKKVF